MYDNLFNELVENGLTSELDEQLEGYYVFNSSQIQPVRLQFDGETQLSPLELQNQNPTLNLDANTLTMCLAPFTNTAPIGCIDAINTFKAGYVTNGGLYDLYINNNLVTQTSWFYRNDTFKNILSTYNVELNAYDGDGNKVTMDSNGYYDGAEVCELINLSDNYVQIKVVCIDASDINQFKQPVNPTAEWDYDENNAGFLTVCLAPLNN